VKLIARLLVNFFKIISQNKRYARTFFNITAEVTLLLWDLNLGIFAHISSEFPYLDISQKTPESTSKIELKAWKALNW
jgi:hypothetical protein